MSPVASAGSPGRRDRRPACRSSSILRSHLGSSEPIRRTPGAVAAVSSPPNFLIFRTRRWGHRFYGAVLTQIPRGGPVRLLRGLAALDGVGSKRHPHSLSWNVALNQQYRSKMGARPKAGMSFRFNKTGATSKTRNMSFLAEMCLKLAEFDRRRVTVDAGFPALAGLEVPGERDASIEDFTRRRFRP